MGLIAYAFRQEFQWTALASQFADKWACILKANALDTSWLDQSLLDISSPEVGPYSSTMEAKRRAIDDGSDAEMGIVIDD